MRAIRTSNPIEVGKRVEAARQLREGDPKNPRPGYSKKEVAEAVGITPGAYTHWINGSTKSYKADNLVKVADYLNVRVEWLLFGELPMEPRRAEQALAEIVDEAPPAVVDEALAFLDYQLQKSVAADPVKLGRYLKMIDTIRQDRRKDSAS